VAARARAWIIFPHSNTGVVGSNPTQGMDVCVRWFCVCVVLCVGRGLDPPSKGSYWLCVGSRNWKSGQGPTKGCSSLKLWIGESEHLAFKLRVLNRTRVIHYVFDCYNWMFPYVTSAYASFLLDFRSQAKLASYNAICLCAMNSESMSCENVTISGSYTLENTGPQHVCQGFL
jgi:hypothetical protein